MSYTKTTNASRRAAQVTPVVVRQAGTYVSAVAFQDEQCEFYAPRWFRRQNKGKTFRAFARELHKDCILTYTYRQVGSGPVTGRESSQPA